jgi:hypothetical protein
MIKLIRRITFRPLRMTVWSFFFVLYFYPVWMVQGYRRGFRSHYIAKMINDFMWRENAK